MLYVAGGGSKADFFTLCPYLIDRIALAAGAFVAPVAIFQCKVELQACAHPDVIAGKEKNIFCVLAILSCIRTSSGSKKFFGVDIISDPLKMSSGKYFHGPTGTRCHLLQFPILHTACD